MIRPFLHIRCHCCISLHANAFSVSSGWQKVSETFCAESESESESESENENENESESDGKSERQKKKREMERTNT